MTIPIASWWLILCGVSVFNMLAWAGSVLALTRRHGVLPAEVLASRRLQVLLSAGYVFGCAYRSALPVYDVQRVCLFDSWLSSVVVGRTVATVAELCFVAQWALMLREIARATGSQAGGVAAALLVPMIALAEACSWYSVLTTSNLGHVFEESIWAFSALLLVASLVAIWPRCGAAARWLSGAWCAAGVAYVGFMFRVDVPMYWSRWIADEHRGRAYLSLAQGLTDVSRRWIVSYRWDDWKHEVAWMTLYFSVAVWLSITLILAPPMERRPVAAGS